MARQKISTYSMKMRLYPSKEQQKMIDDIFRACRIAYNITFHEVFMKNPAVCNEPKEDGSVWPSFSKMTKKEWRAFLISQNPFVEIAPAAALMGKNGLFQGSGKNAWEKGMHKAPIDPDKRRFFHFFNRNKPCRSFAVQVETKNIIPSETNDKVAIIKIPKVGAIKARGFNRKVRFGENGDHSFEEALAAGEIVDKMSVRVTKDTCGDYFVSVTFHDGANNTYDLYLETRDADNKEDIGIDVGIKDIAILSNGHKVENKHFKQAKQKTLNRISKQLSHRWGPCNAAFRDYNKSIRQDNKKLPEDQQKPLAQPSNGYIHSQRKKALIERKIARQRDTYYHQQTAAIVRQSSMIATETLLVSNLMRNHKLAYALADAAMSDFLSKLRYKADRYHVPVLCIGMFEPSSQLCSVCGKQNPRTKNLSVREWTCPHCNTHHDRDVNAAQNILKLAHEKGGIADKVIKEPNVEKTEQTDEPKKKRKPRKKLAIFEDQPEIVVMFSKELTQHNDPRYVVMNTETGEILDDAQGSGYRTATKAKNCYKAKRAWPEKKRQLLSA